MGLLVLLGVVHRDPQGAVYLCKSLEKLRPQALGVELSPLGLLWREQMGPRLLGKLDFLLEEFPPAAKAHPEVRLMVQALGLPFEYLACRDYASSHGIPLHLTDLNWVSREELPGYEKEILTRENLALLLSREQTGLGERILAAYARARRCLDSGGLLKEVGITPPWVYKRGLLREMFMACRIRNMAGRYRVLVHVGGWVHLVQDPRGLSLASLLKDLRPVRMLLRSPD